MGERIQSEQRIPTQIHLYVHIYHVQLYIRKKSRTYVHTATSMIAYIVKFKKKTYDELPGGPLLRLNTFVLILNANYKILRMVLILIK